MRIPHISPLAKKRGYCLQQVESYKGGINHHRKWLCLITGIIINSNEDVLGDKFYIGDDTGEGYNTKWFPSPTAAVKAYLKEKGKTESA